METSAYDITWYTLYITVMFSTVFGNGLILYSVAKVPRLRGNMHILIANLAVSDLIVGAILVPTSMGADNIVSENRKYFCLTSLGFFVLSLGTSCYNMLLISVERFIAISFPLRARTILTKSVMVSMISFGWITITGISAVPLFGVNTFTNSSVVCLPEVVWPKAYQISCEMQLTGNIAVNFVFYMVVVRIAVKKANIRGNIRRNVHLNVHSKTKRDLRQLTTMVIVLGTFMVCWLPYMTLSVIVTLWDTPNLQFVKMCSLVPGLFNSAMNWIIYGYRNKEFNKAFWSILRCKSITSTGGRTISTASPQCTASHISASF